MYWVFTAILCIGVITVNCQEYNATTSRSFTTDQNLEVTTNIYTDTPSTTHIPGPL